MTSRPWSEAAVDGLCLAVALWTLCSHAVVAAGGSLRQLLAGFAPAAALLVAAVLAARRRRGSPQPAWEPPVAATQTLEAPWRAAVRGAGLALGVAGSLAVAWHASITVLWWWTIALLGLAAAVFVVAEAPRSEPPARGPRLEAGLWGLALAAVIVTLIAHRPDIDDSFYVNVAVSAADFPDRPLLAGDTLHGIAGLPLHLPLYRVHSYELANGALSYLTGIPAIVCFHWIAACLVALCVPLAFASLFRLLTPGRWLSSVAALLFVLVAVGETHRWYGNFAFVRMWQGKGFYLYVFLPLVYTYALRFALRPQARTWILLLAAQISAVGCSSSAIWAAPAAALMAMTCALRPRRRDLLRFAVGALASVYVLVAGWLLIEGHMEEHDPLLARAEVRMEARARLPGEELAEALSDVFGSGRLHYFALASILASWACCSRGLGRRFAIVLPLAVWLLLLDPYAERWLRRNLTGPSYWRVLWSVPVPILMTFVLTAPLELRGHLRRFGPVASVAALLSFAWFVPRYGGLSPRNGPVESLPLRFGMPTLKVPVRDYPSDYEWAARLNASVPPGSHVVAPEYVGVWVPTFHHHAYPLVVRQAYLRKYLDRLGRDEVRQRRILTEYAAGTLLQPDAPERFREGLERFDVKAVCLAVTDRAARAREILRDAGFERTETGATHETWVRR